MTDVERQPIKNKSFCEKYNLNEVLAKGSNSTIFKATCIKTGDKVACKLIKETEDSIQTKECTVLEEASKLTESIIEFKDCFHDEDESVIVMGFDENYLTLQDYLQKHIKPTNTDNESKFKTIITQIVETMEILQCNRVNHGDLSTFNVLINPLTLKTKLIDFGVGFLDANEYDSHLEVNLLKELIKTFLKFIVSKDGNATENFLESKLDPETWNFFKRVKLNVEDASTYYGFDIVAEDPYLRLSE